MSRNDETRHIKWHETCKCQCWLDAIVSNNKKRWNQDKCRCECRELVDKVVCEKRYIWNPSNCECECDKSCDFDKYLVYKDCECRIKINAPLIEECNKTVEELKLVKITLAKNSCKCIPLTVLIVLLLVFFTINYYFYSDQINLKNFNASLIKIDKKNYKNWHLLHWLCHFYRNC